MSTTAVQTLDLVPPAVVATVSADTAEKSIPLKPEDSAKIKTQVGSQVEKFLDLDVHSPEFSGYVAQITTLGRDEIANSASASSRLLEEPMRAVKGGSASGSAEVSKNILALRREMEKLDPKNANLLGGAKRLLGVIPFGNAVTDYFNSYASAKSTLDSIVDALRHGKDQIQRDNSSIEVEQQRIWDSMLRLRKFAYYAKELDDALTAQIAEIETTDPERAKVLKEEVLYRLRQRRQSIMTQAAVNTQGYMVIGMIKKTNDDLIIAVDDTTTTSMSAMRNAVLAAQALSAQKNLIDQISGMRNTTSSMIVSVSKMLDQNVDQVAQLSTDPAVSVAALKEAFDNTFKAMDKFDGYKVKALDAIKTSIDGMQEQIDRSKTYLEPERQAMIASTKNVPAIGPIKID